jgi:ADP-heptose:LPS heptosyltransferase
VITPTRHPEPPGHVLVVRPDNNGDVLLAGPAIRAVAATAARVTLWVGPRGRAAAALLPGVDEVVCHELPWIDLAPSPVDREWLDATIDRVVGLSVDRALVLGSFHQSPLPTALVLRAAGVPSIAATSVDYPGALLDLRHRIDDDVHEVERSLSLVRAAGFALPAGDDDRLRIRPWDHVPSPLDPAGRGGGPGAAEPFVVVHPGATAPARTWPPERLAATVDALVAAGWRVVVTGGPDETALTRAVAGPSRDAVVDLGGRTEWWGLARLLADAAALVAGNTGPVHLAAAVGTPVVELFAPVVPAVRWRPWRVPHVLLGDQRIPCAGCRARVCPFEDQPCLRDVDPGDVVAALAQLTGARRRPAEVGAP